MNQKLPVRWDTTALASLIKIYDYISESSEQAANYVTSELVKLASTLNQFPEKYMRDPFLADEPENYRSVNKWHYKIIYEVTLNEIIIINIFHTSQNPSKIKKPE